MVLIYFPSSLQPSSQFSLFLIGHSLEETQQKNPFPHVDIEFRTNKYNDRRKFEYRSLKFKMEEKNLKTN